MKQLILAVLFLFCLSGFADNGSNNNMCSTGAFPSGGGQHDAWPWAFARPFPWTSIQGVWTVANGEESQANLVFEFKVTRTTDKLKQLFVEIYERDNCKKAYMRGVGVVNNAEKNVVRVNMNNVLMKLAMFNTSDLEMDSYTCGPKTLGATFYRLSENDGVHMKELSGSSMVSGADSANLILKKVSNAIEYRCKK